MLLGILSNIAFVTTAKPDKVTKASDDNNKRTIQVQILDAWYEDNDNTGIADDVIVILRFDLSGASTYTLEYTIHLELPSGRTFSYRVGITAQLNSFNITNYFWDHATEPGWYTVRLSAKMNTGGPQFVQESFIFDPPGHDDGDPGFLRFGIS